VSSTDEAETREGWDGILEPPEIDHEAEYIDEDRYTTVTVEAMDLTKDGLHRAAKEAEENSDASKEGKPDGINTVSSQKQGRRIWTKGKPEKEGQSSKAKRKRKKFRYENKTERKMTRFKEKSKNSKQAKARRSE